MLNYLTALIMAVNVFILLGVAYLLFWPAPLPIIYNEPFPLDKTEVIRGEEISYLVHLNKRAEYHAQLNRNIICEDGNLVTLAPQESNVSEGEHWIWVTVTVPYKTSLGRCYLEMNNTYFINSLRREQVALRSQSFNVIE